MKRKLFVVGAALTLFVLAACNQPIQDTVGLEAQRPGNPANVIVTPSADGNWAIVSWTAGANSSEHEIVKRQDGSNPVSVSAWNQRQGGTFAWQGGNPAFTTGASPDQFSAVISLFGLAGDFTVGVRSFPFASVSGVAAPSDVTWDASETTFRVFVPVESIELPQAITRAAGTAINLNSLATVTPANATFQDIEWRVEVHNTGIWDWQEFEGASDGVFTPPFASRFRVTEARIRHGASMEEDGYFTLDDTVAISVDGDSFVRVSSISINSSELPTNAEPGDLIDLNDLATVSPANASNHAVTWVLGVYSEWGWSNANATITGGVLTVPSLGQESVVSVRAIVRNGMFWAGPEWHEQETEGWTSDVSAASATFRITDPNFVPVVGITIPPNTSFTEGAAVNLNALAVVTPANATNRDIVWYLVGYENQWGGMEDWRNERIADGIWTPDRSGLARLSATILNGVSGGNSLTKTFNSMRVEPAPLDPNFVAVTDVILPRSIPTGSQINLNSHVNIVPPNATNQTMRWAVHAISGHTAFSIDAPDGVFPLPTHVTSLSVQVIVENGVRPGQNFSRSGEILIVPANFVPVTGVTLPAEVEAGVSPVNLNALATVAPANATNQNMEWEWRQSAGWSENPIPGGMWTPQSMGTFQLRATVLDGVLPGQNFVSAWVNVSVTLDDNFVPVTGVSNIPERITAAQGAQINLNTGVTVLPANATNSTIQWGSIQVSILDSNSGNTRMVSVAAPGGVFTLPAGFPWEQAIGIHASVSVPNGQGPGSNFPGGGHNIMIVPPGFISVTSIDATVSAMAVVGTPLDLNQAGASTVTVLPVNATNQEHRWEFRQWEWQGWTQIPDGIWVPQAMGAFQLRVVAPNGLAPGWSIASDPIDITVLPVQLVENVWAAGEITTPGGESWFSFEVTAGTTYRLWWNDSHQGNSTKTMDTAVCAFFPDGTSIFTGSDSQWNSPRIFTPTQSGTVMVRFTGWFASSTGTFGIVYSTGTTRPAVTPLGFGATMPAQHEGQQRRP